jgi:glycosyltransferase involved in cell wall biosynthesis
MIDLAFITASLTGGGAERAINQVTRILEKQYSVALICINDSEDDLVEPCADVTFLNRKYNSKFLPTIISYLKFRKALKRIKPRYLVLNCDLPELFGAFSPLGPKIIFIEHSDSPWAKREVLGRFIRRLLKLRRAQCVAVSRHLEVWPKSISPNYVINNPVMILPSNLRAPTTEVLKRLVYIGRFANPQKRPEVVYELCKQAQLPGLMIGEGEERDVIMKLTQESAVNIEFPGQIADPWQLVRSGDLLIVPSTFEGDGLVVVEAILSGIPVLLSDIPEFRRFLLPSCCYCSSFQEFYEKVILYRNSLQELCASEDLKLKLRLERSESRVGTEWDKFLKSF